MVYLLLLIVSLVGNSLVIAVIWKTRKLRTLFNLFIQNMAVADILMPLFAIPRRINNVFDPTGEWLLDGLIGSLTCKLLPFVEFTCIAVSAITLQLIAIQRFVSVVFASKKIQLANSRNKCAIVICLVWLVGAIYPSWLLYKYKISHQGTKKYCKSSWSPYFNHTEARRIEIPIILVAFTIVPFILLTSLYAAIIVFLCRQKARLCLASEARQRKAKKYRRVTYMLLTVVIVFFIAWLPLNIYLFLSTYVWEYKQPCQARHLVFSATLMTYLSASANPSIYFLYLKNFREALKSISCLPRQRQFILRLKSRSTVGAMEDEITFNIKHVPSKAVVLLSVKPLEI